MAIYELDNKKPSLPDKGSYWIASNATVIGDVEMHEGASIWFNTVVRGDCEKITNLKVDEKNILKKHEKHVL